MEYCRFILAAFVTLFVINFVSANFVCGDVLPGFDVSPAWMDVIVYYDENPGDSTQCEINPENKFCCDLDDIESVMWSSGKTVHAEIYDVVSGYVSDIVSLTTSEEAYDVFPTIGISKILDFKNNFSTVLVLEETISFDYVLDERYPNLKVFLNNSEGFFEYDVCRNCSDGVFSLNLSSGANVVSFYANGEKDYFENYTFYALDFFEVEYDFVCEDCKLRDGEFYIPGNSFVELNLNVFTSDDFEGEIELLEYIPADWMLVGGDYFSDFTESHSFVRVKVNSSNFTQKINLKSPSNFWQRKYVFRSVVGDLEFEERAYLYGLFWFGIPLYFDEPFMNISYYQMSLNQYVSKNRPMVIGVYHPNVELIAVYPTEAGIFRGVVSVDEPFLFGSWSTFRVLSNLGDGNIESVVVRLIAEKGGELELTQDDLLVPLEKYSEDSSYDYYRCNLDRLDEFSVRLK